jgi:hypothetical protein
MMFLGTALVLAGMGCDPDGNTFLPRPAPPLTVTYRDSALGIGKVIQITNNSAHHLYDVKWLAGT